MSRRILLFIIVFLLIAVVGAGLFLWNIQKGPPEKDAGQDVASQEEEEFKKGTLPADVTGQEPQDSSVSGDPPAVVESPLHTQLKQQARSYAEIIGSFSTHSNFSNLVALFPFSTESMKKQLSDIIQQNAVENPATVPFRGTQTRALKTDVVLVDEAKGRAVVEVATQRREEVSGGESRTYYQDILIEYVKEGDMWLVDNAAWGEVGP